jgi:hypothetical protein
VVCAVRGLCLPPRVGWPWPHPLTTHASGQSGQVRCPGCLSHLFVHGETCSLPLNHHRLLAPGMMTAGASQRRIPHRSSHNPRGRPRHRGVPACVPANLRAHWCSVESVSAALWAHPKVAPG